MDRYDTGVLQDDELPTATADPPNRDGWIAALMFWLMLTVRGAQARDLLRNQFEAQSFRLGLLVSLSPVSLSAVKWQRGMQTALTHYATRMAVAGAGKLPGASVQATVESQLSNQWPFLQRFATQIMARKIVERPMSGAEITARAKLYGGPTGWASYFIGQGSIQTPGWVDVWVSRDDGHVCDLCFPRHQIYFLPGIGVMPGDSCRGNCRCVRLPEYIPDIFDAIVSGRSEQIHPVQQRSNERQIKKAAFDKRFEERIKETL